MSNMGGTVTADPSLYACSLSVHIYNNAVHLGPEICGNWDTNDRGILGLASVVSFVLTFRLRTVCSERGERRLDRHRRR